MLARKVSKDCTLEVRLFAPSNMKEWPFLGRARSCGHGAVLCDCRLYQGTGVKKNNLGPTLFRSAVRYVCTPYLVRYGIIIVRDASAL